MLLGRAPWLDGLRKAVGGREEGPELGRALPDMVRDAAGEPLGRPALEGEALLGRPVGRPALSRDVGRDAPSREVGRDAGLDEGRDVGRGDELDGREVGLDEGRDVGRGEELEGRGLDEEGRP